ncbi:hypothetical protein [Streptomyces sp900116325]|uniref:hypothetical protein n=1 Tax=Streptomyces sp. 900116325 TaxID=3154295 RepID=UPI0033A7CD96
MPGAFLTSVVACAYVTTDTLTPAGRNSEAYAWLILAIGARQSARTALAGRLTEQPLASAALPAAGLVRKGVSGRGSRTSRRCSRRDRTPTPNEASVQALANGVDLALLMVAADPVPMHAGVISPSVLGVARRRGGCQGPKALAPAALSPDPPT